MILIEEFVREVSKRTVFIFADNFEQPTRDLETRGMVTRHMRAPYAVYSAYHI